MIVYRDKALRNYQLYAYAAWAGYTIVNNTFQSSKTAGPVAAAWAVMNYIGDEGYYRQMLKTYVCPVHQAGHRSHHQDGAPLTCTIAVLLPFFSSFLLQVPRHAAHGRRHPRDEG